MVTTTYLPDIMSGIVDRVKTFFEFGITYGKGLYNQVGNDMATDFQVMIWLVMPFEESFSKKEIFASVNDAKIILAAPTEAGYTMQQREDINFKPFLLPVYEKLKGEIAGEESLGYPEFLKHHRRILPYWAGGDVAAPGQPNLWKKFYDCIEMRGIEFNIENIKTCTFLSNILN